MKRVLPSRLSESQIADRGKLAAALSQEQTRLEEERKHVDGQFKERIGGVKNRISALMTEMREEAELVEVECEWRVDLRRNLKELRRLDTGAVVDTQALSPEDRQASLFSVEDDDREALAL